MSRYIDADVTELAVIKATTYGDALRAVREQPSIDIVRCKECKWAEPNGEGDYDCKCHIPTFRIKADDFCSHGSRSEKPNNSERSSE